MDRSLAVRRVGSKGFKGSSGSKNSSPARGGNQSGSNNYKGQNAVCQRETPVWQKPITKFFNKVDEEAITKHPVIDTKNSESDVKHSEDNGKNLEVGVTND